MRIAGEGGGVDERAVDAPAVARRLSPRSGDVDAYGDEIWPMRSFLGRRMRGGIVGIEAVRSGPDVKVTIRQKHGPAENFQLYRSAHSPAARVNELMNSVGAGAAWSLCFAAVLILVMCIADESGSSALPLAVGLLAAAFCTLAAAVCARIYWWSGTTARSQRCGHAQSLPETLTALGSPDGEPWAAEALNALREGRFCRQDGRLHRLMQQPATDLVPAARATREVESLVVDAAVALRKGGRILDAADLLLFAEVVPSLSVLDSETVRQAAQTILDSHRLLAEIPAARRTVCPLGSTTTPEQDATAAVDGALRGIDAILTEENDSDIAALQALRAYSTRWH